jgi:hypothetical protein
MMNHVLTLILILTFFSYSTRESDSIITGQKITFRMTGLKVFCARTINALDNEIHGISYTNKAGQRIDIDSISRLLYKISELDDFNISNCKFYNANQKETWEKLNPKDSVYKIETLSYTLENSENNTGNKTNIVLTDYYVYLGRNPGFISIRFLNDNDIIKINIDKDEIVKRSESIPLGLHKAIEKLDSIKNTSR